MNVRPKVTKTLSLCPLSSTRQLQGCHCRIERMRGGARFQHCYNWTYEWKHWEECRLLRLHLLSKAECWWHCNHLPGPGPGPGMWGDACWPHPRSPRTAAPGRQGPTEQVLYSLSQSAEIWKVNILSILCLKRSRTDACSSLLHIITLWWCQ